jgi:hypothetical protein
VVYKCVSTSHCDVYDNPKFLFMVGVHVYTYSRDDDNGNTRIIDNCPDVE